MSNTSTSTLREPAAEFDLSEKDCDTIEIMRGLDESQQHRWLAIGNLMLGDRALAAAGNSIAALWLEWSELQRQWVAVEMEERRLRPETRMPGVLVGNAYLRFEGEAKKLPPSERAAGVAAVRAMAAKTKADDERDGVTALDKRHEELGWRISELVRRVQALPCYTFDDVAALLDMALEYDVEMPALEGDMQNLRHLMRSLELLAPSVRIGAARRRLILSEEIVATADELSLAARPSGAASPAPDAGDGDARIELLLAERSRLEVESSGSDLTDAIVDAAADQIHGIEREIAATSARTLHGVIRKLDMVLDGICEEDRDLLTGARDDLERLAAAGRASA